MESNNFLLVVAVVAVAISFAGVAITYDSVSLMKNWITGFAATSGTINLTVETSTLINFTTDKINWGSGRVTDQFNATLNTAAGTSNVTGGNFTGNTAGFIVENLGNVNLSFKLSSAKTAITLLGGTGAMYQWNVTNNDSNSCKNASTFNLGQFYDVNITAPGTIICDKFQPELANDQIRIDIKLVVPSDSITGVLSDTITASVAAS